MFTIAPGYPGDAIGGADFFTLSGQRLVADVDPQTGEKVTRKERVVVVDRLILHSDLIEGRPCIGEQTIRSLGAELGLYDVVTVTRLRDEVERLTRRVHEVDAENTELRNIVAGLERVVPYRRDELTFTPVDFIEPVQPLEEVF